MDNYQCKNCSTLIQNSSIPRISGCPDASSHNWTKLGPVGDINYQCKKCGTLAKMAKEPRISGCPKASSHHWTKL